MAFKSEELVLALITEEDGRLFAVRSCGGTQKECNALDFSSIVQNDPENLKILRGVLENTLEKIKTQEKEMERERGRGREH